MSPGAKGVREMVEGDKKAMASKARVGTVLGILKHIT